MKIDYDVVIIGSGVAGMSAAIYLKRGGINCCILEKEVPGGQINKSSSVRNYPGVIDVTGPDLSNTIFQQVNDLGITYKYGNVLEIILEDNVKIIKTDLEEIRTNFIIIATGRKPRKLGLPNEDKLLSNGISYCALCDGNFFKNEDVAVIGGSNAALEEAIYLANICKSVTIIHRRHEFRADKILQEQIKQIKNIKLKLCCVPKAFNEEDNKLNSITIVNEDNEEEDLYVKGCFIYIGQVPSSELFKNIVKCDSDGYIKIDKHNRTNVKGIYAAGDIVKKDAYQLITAMSDGVIAAVNCIKEISK